VKPGHLWWSIASAWAWFTTGLIVLVWLPLMAVLFVVTVPFDRSRYVVGRWFRIAAMLVAKTNPFWKFRISGVSIDDPRRPYVVVANHESFADILLISYLPWEMKWVSKAEFFRIPVVGWEMRLAGDIPLRRGSPTSAGQAMADARNALRRKVSVMFFPEGTRSPTGELLPFKDGAFRLAIKAGVPILPLAVAGTGTALPKHDWRFGRAVAEVEVLPPVETAGLTLKDAAALKNQVRDLIEQARARSRERIG